MLRREGESTAWSFFSAYIRPCVVKLCIFNLSRPMTRRLVHCWWNWRKVVLLWIIVSQDVPAFVHQLCQDMITSHLEACFMHETYVKRIIWVHYNLHLWTSESLYLVLGKFVFSWLTKKNNFWMRFMIDNCSLFTSLYIKLLLSFFFTFFVWKICFIQNKRIRPYKSVQLIALNHPILSNTFWALSSFCFFF